VALTDPLLCPEFILQAPANIFHGQQLGCGWKSLLFPSLRANPPSVELEFVALGFGPLDAMHLAFAEASAARWFVTTDDRLLKVATRHREQLRVAVVMPGQVPLEMEGDQA
jgi:hypothetical protein